MTFVPQSLFPGNVQIFGSKKIQDFFHTFSKTIISFTRLKVIKQVINRDLKKSRNKALSTMRCKRTCTGKIEHDLTSRKKISLVKHLLQLSKNFLQFFSGLFLCFSDFFQVCKIAGQISRLFQEFKTLYEPFLL